MDVVALRLHSGSRTGLYQEDPRSPNRDLWHPSDFLRRYGLKARTLHEEEAGTGGVRGIQKVNVAP
jgi:hypothetical protein